MTILTVFKQDLNMTFNVVNVFNDIISDFNLKTTL